MCPCKNLDVVGLAKLAGQIAQADADFASKNRPRFVPLLCVGRGTKSKVSEGITKVSDRSAEASE
jgi:hypothetical protein